MPGIKMYFATCVRCSIFEVDEIAKPKKVIKQFCATFKHSYAEIELLDLLDAVITYDGSKKLYKGNLVLFYQWMKWLIYLTYKFEK